MPSWWSSVVNYFAIEEDKNVEDGEETQQIGDEYVSFMSLLFQPIPQEVPEEEEKTSLAFVMTKVGKIFRPHSKQPTMHNIYKPIHLKKNDRLDSEEFSANVKNPKNLVSSKSKLNVQEVECVIKECQKISFLASLHPKRLLRRSKNIEVTKEENSRYIPFETPGPKPIVQNATIDLLINKIWKIWAIPTNPPGSMSVNTGEEQIKNPYQYVVSEEEQNPSWFQSFWPSNSKSHEVLSESQLLKHENTSQSKTQPTSSQTNLDRTEKLQKEVSYNEVLRSQPLTDMHESSNSKNNVHKFASPSSTYEVEKSQIVHYPEYLKLSRSMPFFTKIQTRILSENDKLEQQRDEYPEDEPHSWSTTDTKYSEEEVPPRNFSSFLPFLSSSKPRKPDQNLQNQTSDETTKPVSTVTTAPIDLFNEHRENIEPSNETATTYVESEDYIDTENDYDTPENNEQVDNNIDPTIANTTNSNIFSKSHKKPISEMNMEHEENSRLLSFFEFLPFSFQERPKKIMYSDNLQISKSLPFITLQSEIYPDEHFVQENQFEETIEEVSGEKDDNVASARSEEESLKLKNIRKIIENDSFQSLF